MDERDEPAAQVTRRTLLGWGLAAGVAAGADLSVPGMLEHLRRTSSAQDAVVWASLTRPADQLWLRWELLNFRLLRAGDAGPGDPATARLVIADVK